MLYNDLSDGVMSSEKLTKDEEIRLLKEEIRFLKHRIRSLEHIDQDSELHTCSFCNVSEEVESDPVVEINPHWICSSCKQKIQKESAKLLKTDT